jgi:hypothetical protein
VLVFLLPFTLLQNPDWVLVPASTGLRVGDTHIKHTLTAAYPETQDAFIPTVFIVISRLRVVRLVHSLLLIHFNFTKVTAISEAIPVHLVVYLLLGLTRCSTANTRFVNYTAWLKGAASQISPLIRHIIMANVYKATHFA